MPWPRWWRRWASTIRRELTPDLMVKRINDSQVQTFTEIYHRYEPNVLVDGTAPERYQQLWDRASAEVFTPQHVGIER